MFLILVRNPHQQIHHMEIRTYSTFKKKIVRSDCPQIVKKRGQATFWGKVAWPLFD